MPPDSIADARPRQRDAVTVSRHLLATVAVLALVGVVLALLLVQRLGTTYRDGLEVTVDGADVAALAATSAEALAANLSALADAAGDSLTEARDLVVIASSSTADVGTALGSNIAEGVSGTASIADGMAGFIETIERFIPGDSDSLAEDLRALSDGLEPVPDQLRTLAAQLADSSIELDATAVALETITTQIDALAAGIDEARTALLEARALSTDLAGRARDALDRSSTDLWLARLLVVVLGLGVAGAAIAAHRALGLLDAPGRS